MLEVAAGAGDCFGDVAATEQDTVQKQRRQLVKTYALAPAVGKWGCVVVTGKHLFKVGVAKELEHGKVGLGMATVGHGINQGAAGSGSGIG